MTIFIIALALGVVSLLFCLVWAFREAVRKL